MEYYVSLTELGNDRKVFADSAIDACKMAFPEHDWEEVAFDEHADAVIYLGRRRVMRCRKVYETTTTIRSEQS